MTIRPYALSPYGRILLYTPTCSRDLTIARGVQGMMDLTVPGGGVSLSIAVLSGAAAEEVEEDESRDCGAMNRMLATEFGVVAIWMQVLPSYL